MKKQGIAEVISQFRDRMDETGFTSRQKTVMTHLSQCHTPVDIPANADTHSGNNRTLFSKKFSV
jgi:hypothetical protein